MVKVLLTSVYKPFGIDNNLGSKRILPEMFEGQITFAQEIFGMRHVLYTWGLDLIAANIETPTTVMHYPSLKEFVNELKKEYDYVGINCVTSTFDKAKIMVGKIRKFSPKAKIILGGYGTITSGAEELVDYVCKSEGIGFMKNILNESEDDKKINFPVKLTQTTIMGFPVAKRVVFTLSLGCPTGCDFCCTSYFHNRRRIPFVKEGKIFFEELLKIEKKTGIIDFDIIDEDLILQKKFLTDFAYYNSKREKPFFLSCFGSAKAISRYTPQELVRIGIGTIWIGIESKNSHFEKLKEVDIKKLISSLQEVGITVIGSFILGLSYHDEKTLREDFEEYLSLSLTLPQFIINTPHRGTPLYEQLEKSGKLFKNVPNKNIDGFSLIFDHPNFTPKRLSELQISFYKEDYERLGPSVFRYVETQLKGYKNLKNSSDSVLRARAQIYKETCISIYPLIPTGIKYAPNNKIRVNLKKLLNELYAEFGKPSLSNQIKAFVVSLKAVYCWKTRNKVRINNPSTIITRYRM